VAGNFQEVAMILDGVVDSRRISTGDTLRVSRRRSSMHAGRR